jgi:uncharacterized protein (TIGR02001 family)
MTKTTTLLSALALATAAGAPAVAMAEVTGNIGYSSDYIYRGIFQSESSPYAGADFTSESGFYLGTWWADVTNGVETDVYFGWQGGSDNVQFKVGYTAYRYLDDFDGDYDEVNLGLYAGIFALDVAVGEYDAEKVWGLGTQDYLFTSVTLSPEAGPYYKLGIWDGDVVDTVFPLITKTGADSGEYIEIGYTYSLEEAGVDFSAALIYSDDLPLAINGFGNPDAGDYTLTFGIKKTFSMKE